MSVLTKDFLSIQSLSSLSCIVVFVVVRVFFSGVFSPNSAIGKEAIEAQVTERQFEFKKQDRETKVENKNQI